MRGRAAAVRMQGRAADARAAAYGQHHGARWRRCAWCHTARQGHQVTGGSGLDQRLMRPIAPLCVFTTIPLRLSDACPCRLPGTVCTLFVAEPPPRSCLPPLPPPCTMQRAATGRIWAGSRCAAWRVVYARFSQTANCVIMNADADPGRLTLQRANATSKSCHHHAFRCCSWCHVKSKAFASHQRRMLLAGLIQYKNLFNNNKRHQKKQNQTANGGWPEATFVTLS